MKPGRTARGKAGAVIAVAAGLFSSGCGLPFMREHKLTRVFIPPPPPQPQPKEPVPQIPAAPEIQFVAVSLPGRPDSSGTVLVELAPLPAPPARRPAPAPPKVQATAPTPAQPEPPAVAPPKLGQLFTPEQAREYNQALAESFARVDSALARLEGKHLSAEQSETAERIRTFRRQAEQAREQDLVTAVSLARRADLLAKDLLGRLP